ncbi:hypothetical protein [Haematospirillum jordaniae]|nr:hypothetical protein [Haematospirillum jordaniae]NKD84470.1 hypothetical protein [Haematospirillum jordaniae]NKD86644.1 hypothetical protein [Haematospirillum jordaniae]
MTCGVYGLIDPETGLVRWVAASRNIELVFRLHCNLSWHTPPGVKVTPWLIGLHRAGKAPILKILQVCEESDFGREKREQVAIYELVGGADLNTNYSANARNNSCS